MDKVGKLDEIEKPELKVYNSLVTTSLYLEISMELSVPKSSIWRELSFETSFN
jgi:hypothetical protein